MNNLKNCILFDNMTKEQINNFITTTSSYYQEYEKHEHILFEGDEIKEICIVISGELILYKLDANGNKNVIDKLNASDYYGSAIAIKGKNSLSNIEVFKKSTLLHIPVEGLNTNSCELTMFFKNIAKSIALKNISLNQKLYLVGIKSARLRILEYLNYYKVADNEPFEIPLNKNQLAEYLLIDRSTLSRELSKMKNENLISYQNLTFTIINNA